MNIQQIIQSNNSKVQILTNQFNFKLKYTFDSTTPDETIFQFAQDIENIHDKRIITLINDNYILSKEFDSLCNTFK